MKTDMTSERINILIASDINYAPYYGVMLTSLFENNRESKFDIHLLTDSTWSDKVSAKFEKLVDKYDSEFHVHIVDEKKMENLPTIGHINKASYYNLCAPLLLPESINKIIYLDGDMIINGSIRPLWELDLQGKACAMVPNCTYFDQSYYDRLGYDNQYGYYNNGTTVYDLEWLRKNNFTTKALQYIEEKPERSILMDQDAQNALLHDQILELPFEYNFQVTYLNERRWNTYPNYFRDKVIDAAEHPIIIHYCDRLKPWHYQYYLMPFDKLWNKYCRMSLWKDCIVRKPMISYVKHLLKRVIMHHSLMKIRNKEFIPESLEFS